MDTNNEPAASPDGTTPRSSAPVMDIQRPRSAPQGPTPAYNATPSNAPTPSPAPAPVTSPGDGSGNQNPMAINAAPGTPHKSGAPVGVIIVAVIIGLTLAALAVFAYLKTNKPSAGNTANQSQQSGVTPAEVDQTTKGIDESMKSLDDSKDFSQDDLSDPTLGL